MTLDEERLRALAKAWDLRRDRDIADRTANDAVNWWTSAEEERRELRDLLARALANGLAECNRLRSHVATLIVAPDDATTPEQRATLAVDLWTALELPPSSLVSYVTDAIRSAETARDAALGAVMRTLLAERDAADARLEAHAPLIAVAKHVLAASAALADANRMALAARSADGVSR